MSLRLTSSALALVAMTAPAFADVTPEQVWQSWVDYYKSVGYTVTEGSRDTAGSTLTVKDVVVSGGAEGTKINMKIPQTVMSDEGDGKVRTTYPDQMTMDVSGTEPDGGTYALPVVIDMPGNAFITSGAPEDMTHEFTYPTLNITLTKMTVDGAEKDIPVSVKIENSTGKMHIAGTTDKKYDYDGSTGKVTFDGDVAGDNAEKVKFAGSMDGFQTQGSMTTSGTVTDLETQMSAALKAGMAMAGVVKAGPMAATFEFSGKDENNQPTSGAGTYDGKGFDLTFGLSKDGVDYQIGSDAVKFEMTSPQFPFPVRYGIDSASFNLKMPLMQAEEPQPFKLAYSLAGLTIGDEMWSMFDAEGKLPRDPASLDLDLTGLVKVDKDLMDVAQQEAAGDDSAPADQTDSATADGVDPAAPADDAEAMADDQATQDAEEPSPIQPIELAINQFALNALGAKISATGNLKAPESGDMNAPVGEIHAKYQGVNGLLDKLGTMGLIPQDQLMSVRMMLGMFARPDGDSADNLKTDLEFKDGGAIFANGQQIK